ncbi:hypothetical protein Poly30_02330 [Planctomycetes bacterium Poly30]|uniref:Right handed beta helix domain-containing protein n=1 Tax=Saltatorellus ferox TaxID=2528018 RepID=A0A518EKX8_9BACT|nr:hypothetical protein Poly30_02330 [Planctomycetes bacterium Poly30]
MICLVLAACVQSTWIVDAGGTAPGAGTASDPYTSITYALEQPATVSGDTVLVRPGTYSDEAVDFLGKNVLLRSTAGSATTRIVGVPLGPDPAPAIKIASGETAVLVEGFTVAGDAGARGYWPVAPNTEVGAGILCSGSVVTVKDVVLTGGQNATAGAGIFAISADLTLDRVTLTANGRDSYTQSGGGIYADSSTIVWRNSLVVDNEVDFRGAGGYLENCNTQLNRVVFRDNGGFYSAGNGLTISGGTLVADSCSFTGHISGDPGGAIIVDSAADVELRSCVFRWNAGGGPDPYPGGAIRLSGGDLRIFDTLFESNSGQFGGAISALQPMLIEGCTFVDNMAAGAQEYGSYGGAIACVAGTRIERSVFVGNRAQDTFSDGGGAIYGAADIVHCTFVNNVANPGDPGAVGGTGSILENCIVRGQPGSIGSASATYSNVEGGAAGTGNFDADPLFWSSLSDVRLLPGSPCIDSGDPASAVDPDGTRADVGAFAFDPNVGAPIGMTSCIANVNSTGASAALVARGSTVAADDRVTLHVEDSPGGALGYFLSSQTPDSTSLGGGSQGLLCLGGNVLRFSASVLDDRGTGVVSFHPRLGAFPQGTVAMAGETWLFQYWFRDANPGATSNTSGAVSVTLN